MVLHYRPTDVLNHVFRNPVHLLLRLHVWQRIKIEIAIALNQSRTNPFQLIAILGGGTIVFGPNEMNHFLNANLRPWLDHFRKKQKL